MRKKGKGRRAGPGTWRRNKQSSEKESGNRERKSESKDKNPRIRVLKNKIFTKFPKMAFIHVQVSKISSTGGQRLVSGPNVWWGPWGNSCRQNTLRSLGAQHAAFPRPWMQHTRIGWHDVNASWRLNKMSVTHLKRNAQSTILGFFFAEVKERLSLSEFVETRTRWKRWQALKCESVWNNFHSRLTDPNLENQLNQSNHHDHLTLDASPKKSSSSHPRD